jgi:hypothetical protein
MRRFKTIVGATCAAAFVTVAAAGAQGIVPDRTTFVTISAPVSVPGTVLPAGEYMFRLADTQASRNVIQIFDKERSKIFATLITVAAERNEPSGDAVITFRETAADAPPALRYWYYAGEKGGHEFVYPREQAMQIARASGESVLAIDTTSTEIDAMSKGDISRIEGKAMATTEQPESQPSAAAPAAPATPAESTSASETTAQQPALEQPERSTAAQTPAEAQPTESAAAAQPAQPVTQQAESERPAATPMTGASAAAPQPTGTSGREMSENRDDAAPTDGRELPRTASELPFVALTGVLALGAFLGMRAFRRRVLV